MRGRASVVAVVLALLTVGCTSGDDQRPQQATPTSVAAEEIVATTTMTSDGGLLAVDVLPLLRVADGRVLLTLDLSVEDAPTDGGGLAVPQGFDDPRSDGLGEAGLVRLLDLDTDVVHLVAADAQGAGVVTPDDAGWSDVAADETARLQALFAAPSDGTEELALLLPGSALVDSVPIVDGEAPASDSPLDPATVTDAAVVPMESFVEDLGGAVRTRTTSAEAEVAVATDVLFAFDSADLTAEAQAVLDAAADDVRQRTPGEVSVVGHTDDSGADDYNLDLSRRRAQAVADALGPTLGADYPLRVDGRGETEPIVANDSEKNRSLNRRVEIVIATQEVAADNALVTGELPPAPALVATGAQGVVINDQRPFRIRMPQARRLAGHLVLEVEIIAEDDEVGSVFAPQALLWSGTSDPRGTSYLDFAFSARGLTVLQGSRATYPFDHLMSANDPTSRVCVCEPRVGGLDGGQTLAVAAVFPDVGDVDSIVVQVGDAADADSFRLTDILVS